jgi:hypothetical protein
VYVTINRCVNSRTGYGGIQARVYCWFGDRAWGGRVKARQAARRWLHQARAALGMGPPRGGIRKGTGGRGVDACIAKHFAFTPSRGFGAAAWPEYDEREARKLAIEWARDVTGKLTTAGLAQPLTPHTGFPGRVDAVHREKEKESRK